MRLRWAPSASADLDAIQRYIAEDSLAAAGRMRERMASVAERLIDQPMMGRPGKVESTRELVVPRTPYLLVYRAAPGFVEILRVIHGAQQWPPR